MTNEERLAMIRDHVASGFEDCAAADRDLLLRLYDVAVARNADLQTMLNTAKATELQLDARIRELTAERDAARAQPPPKPLDVCGTPLECGAHCAMAKHHPSPCLCVGDVDGVPGTCPA